MQRAGEPKRRVSLGLALCIAAIAAQVSCAPQPPALPPIGGTPALDSFQRFCLATGQDYAAAVAAAHAAGDPVRETGADSAGSLGLKTAVWDHASGGHGVTVSVTTPAPGAKGAAARMHGWLCDVSDFDDRGASAAGLKAWLGLPPNAPLTPEGYGFTLIDGHLKFFGAGDRPLYGRQLAAGEVWLLRPDVTDRITSVNIMRMQLVDDGGRR